MPLSVTRPFLTPSNDSTTVTTPGALRAMSHALEDVSLHGLPGAQLVVGIQHLSVFHREEKRYRALAAACAHLWICAVYDDPPPAIDGITFVQICAEWPMADERFVVMNAPGFASALLATEVIGRRSGQEGGFQTMFTSDARLVNAICRSLAIELDLHMSLPAARDPEAQQINLRRFNKLALEYQERHAPRRTAPLVAHPRWTPPLVSPTCHFGERVVGGAEA
ncbi:MAG: hypothetical protein HGB28_01190 [Oscillochloris sp.]|nr:hypothetical protein [Oscillochloris sp.]